LTRELTERTKDFVLAFGERLSAFILSEILNNNDIPAAYLDARKVIKTNQHFGHARVRSEESYQNIRRYFEEIDAQTVPVVTGFIASAQSGETTTLGRGGSDYTASLLAAAMEADS